MALIFLSYRMEGLDAEVAASFAARLRALGHDVFLAADSVRIGDNWKQAIENKLATCDYFLVLLSERSSLSEMVIAEVRRARQRRGKGTIPVLLPVRIRHPLSKGLAYDLEAYLENIQQREWNDEEDTDKLIDEMARVISVGSQFHRTLESGPAERPSDDERPLPIADPEPQGGVLGTSSRFYLERPNLDDELVQRILRRERQLIKLEGPEQIGKSSLLARLAVRAAARNLATASISFQLAIDGQLETAKSGIGWFCRTLTRQLGQTKDFFKEQWPGEEDGPATAALEYLAGSLLPKTQSNVVVCIDNLDQAFEYPAFSKSFLPLLRAIFDQGAGHRELGKLRVVVAYSTECWVPLPANKSPFEGVGYTKVAPPFSKAEVAELCQRHQLDLSDEARTALLGLLAGQPYLTRLALHEASRTTTDQTRPDAALAFVLRDCATDQGLFGDHLRKKLIGLERASDPRLKDAMRTVVRSEAPVELSTELALRLLGTGLVARNRNSVGPSSTLYRDYFRDKL